MTRSVTKVTTATTITKTILVMLIPKAVTYVNVRGSSLKCLLFLSDCNQTRFCLTGFHETSPHVTLSSGRRAVPYERTERRDAADSRYLQAKEPESIPCRSNNRQTDRLHSAKMLHQVPVSYEHNKVKRPLSLTKDQHASSVLCHNMAVTLRTTLV